MAGLSDHLNTGALHRNTPKPCGDPSLTGFRIYPRSQRHRNRVFPAFLSYQLKQQSAPSPPAPPPQYKDERTRLLFEGLQNNGRFVFARIFNDLEDERRAEEARAAKALEREHAELKSKEKRAAELARHKEKEEEKKVAAIAARIAAIEAQNRTQVQRATDFDQVIRTTQRSESQHQKFVERWVESQQLTPPEHHTEAGHRTEAEHCTGAEGPVKTEQQTGFQHHVESEHQIEAQQQPQTEQESEVQQPSDPEGKVEIEPQAEAHQTRQRAPSFDLEFDTDRGIFSNPLDQFNGANPFTDFDGDHTHLHRGIDHGFDRGNLSDSDSDDNSDSGEGSDQASEEDSSSEDEFAGTDPFADFDGDHTHLHVPIDFSESEENASEEISTLELEQGRASEPEQDELPHIFEDSPEQDRDQDTNMDSIDEILAAAHSVDYMPEDEDEDEDMGDDIDLDYEDGDDIGEDDEQDMDAMPSAPFNPIAMGLKEIGGLAHFRVSSYKPGNGVDELKSDDTDRYWQSDGVQPHRLTMAFVKEAEIRALRFYVDYIQDESYTPTKIIWKAGTSENNLFKFAKSELVNPSGWVDVPITGAGGGEDGNSLMAWVVRMEVVENHQNGKDTHIRGIKIYGFDDQLRAAGPTTGATFKDGAEGDVGFKVDETKNAEENEKALMLHLRNKDFERSMGVGDPSGTASSLDFIEDPVLR